MSAFRIRYGLAYGPEGTAGSTSANHLLPPQDASPDVTNGTFFVTNNTSAVTYTYFDLNGPDPVSRNQGKTILILFQDANTTVQNSGNIYLSDTQGALPSGSFLELVQYNSGWYEKARSVNDQTPQNPKTVRTVSYSFSGSIGSFNVTTADVVYLTASAAASVVTGFVGGVSAQSITVKVVSVATSVYFAQSAGVLQLAGTGTFLSSDSAFYRFFTQNGVLWYSESGLVSP